MKPTVLIVTTTNWVPTARLAVALVEAGFRLETLCPEGHPVGYTGVSSRIHTYKGLTPLRSVVRAIGASNPDLILPGDDLATRHLQDLHRSRDENAFAPKELRLLIERSLGSPEAYPLVQSRAAFIAAAREQGIRVPKTATIESAGDIENWIKRTGLPMVLKADRTSGGDGVRIAATAAEAQHGFLKLHAPPLAARAFKRAVVDRDRTLIWPSLRRERPTVNAQSFVAGYEATSTVVCWQGRVLASLHFEVLRKSSAAGHATVVRVLENKEIATAVEKIVRRLNLSGICGLDFMLEASSGHAYLIEINPRATQVGHITLGVERDLPGALYAAISGRPSRLSTPTTDNDTIALFPHEWARDPQSEFLRTGYHDVPWSTPGLVHACIQRSKKQSVWYARADAEHEISTVPATMNLPEDESTATSMAAR